MLKRSKQVEKYRPKWSYLNYYYYFSEKYDTYSTSWMTAFFEKKRPNSEQRIYFETALGETAVYRNCKIIVTIAEFSFLLSSKIEVFATVVKGFQLLLLQRAQVMILEATPIHPPSIIIFGKVVFHLAPVAVF